LADSTHYVAISQIQAQEANECLSTRRATFDGAEHIEATALRI